MLPPPLMPALNASPPPPSYGCNDAYVPVEPQGVALGWFLTGATLIAPAPQLLMLCRSRSSLGVSLLTPAMALTYGALNLCATVIAKWPSIERCGDSEFPPWSAEGCVDQLLDALQQAASALGLVGILILTVAYPPNHTARDRLLCAGTLLGLLGALVAAVAVSAASPCSAASYGLSQVYAAVSALVVIIAFAPQLHETFRSKGRGSLSALFYAIQSVGAGLVVCLQLFVLGDSVLVWGPTAVAMLMQGAILLLLLYYRRCGGGAGGSGGPGDDPLLVRQTLPGLEPGEERFTPGFEDQRAAPRPHATKPLVAVE